MTENRSRAVYWFLAALMVIAEAAAARAEEKPGAQQPAQQPAAEEELVIVKYGSLSVKSADPNAKVFIDETYRGMSNTVIENIMTGAHAVSCVLEDKTVTGAFTIKKNELLRLEARFPEGKLVNLAEQETVAAPKKKEPEPVKRQEKKKAEEPKKVEKSPEEERRELHLNIFKIEFSNRESEEVSVAARANPKIISGYSESRGRTGKYYRTKSGLLLCEAGPCVQEWLSKFFYADETGKRDPFMITWKQTVFSGMTPSGTSSRELTWCLKGTCKKLTDPDTSSAPITETLGGYTVTWTKESAVFRRSDIVKDILDAGGTVPE